MLKRWTTTWTFTFIRLILSNKLIRLHFKLPFYFICKFGNKTRYFGLINWPHFCNFASFLQCFLNEWERHFLRNGLTSGSDTTDPAPLWSEIEQFSRRSGIRTFTSRMPVRRRSRKSLKTICSSFFRQFLFIYHFTSKYFAQTFQCSLGISKWPSLVRLSNFDGRNVHDESLVFEVLLRNFRKQNIKSMSTNVTMW